MSLDTKNAYDEVPLEVAQRYAKSPPMLRSMIQRGQKLTRANYLGAAWGNDMPEPWTWGHEAELPECFQADDAVPEDPQKRPYKQDTLSSPATKTPVANPVINGRVVSPHSMESLRARGYRVLTPSGKAFVIPTGQRSPKENPGD
jgi:hypothetical protein